MPGNVQKVWSAPYEANIHGPFLCFFGSILHTQYNSYFCNSIMVRSNSATGIAIFAEPLAYRPAVTRDIPKAGAAEYEGESPSCPHAARYSLVDIDLWVICFCVGPVDASHL